MRISASGGATSQRALIPNGRLFVPPAFYQTGSDEVAQLDSANDWIAMKFRPECIFSFTQLSFYITAVATAGNVTLALYNDDGAADSSPSTLNYTYGTVSSGSSADVWVKKSSLYPIVFSPGQTCWLVAKGAAGADFSMSLRRWNTTLGSMPYDNASTKLSTDGGSSWTAATQDSKPAFWNCILGSSYYNVPDLFYGRYNGKYIYLPGLGMREIPEIGLNAVTNGLTDGTTYYVYVYDNSGTMTLRISATIPILSGEFLVESGAPNRRLVGRLTPRLIAPGEEGAVDCMDRRLVLNYYNKVAKPLGKLNPYAGATTDAGIDTSLEGWNGSATEWKCEFLSDGISQVRLNARSHILTEDSLAVRTGIGLDSVSAIASGTVQGYALSAEGEDVQSQFCASLNRTVASGLHYAVPLQIAADAAAGQTHVFMDANNNSFASVEGLIWC